VRIVNEALDLLELSQSELFARNTQGESVAMFTRLRNCRVLHSCLLSFPNTICIVELERTLILLCCFSCKPPFSQMPAAYYSKEQIDPLAIPSSSDLLCIHNVHTQLDTIKYQLQFS
jgi:hypothetical protein